MKKYIKYFISCLVAFIVLNSVSCGVVTEPQTPDNPTSATTTQASHTPDTPQHTGVFVSSDNTPSTNNPSDTEKTPVSDITPEIKEPATIEVDGNSFDIPEDELKLLNIKEGESVLKNFLSTPMHDIGFGELSGNKTNMAEVINNSRRFYIIYDEEINSPRKMEIADGEVGNYGVDRFYSPRQIPVVLNYADSYVDLFASVEVTKNLKQIEILDIYLILSEGAGGEGIYIYFVTNYGEYIFYKQSTYYEVNEYLFPAQFMYTLAPKLCEELIKHGDEDGVSISAIDIEALFDMSEYIVGGAKKE